MEKKELISKVATIIGHRICEMFSLLDGRCNDHYNDESGKASCGDCPCATDAAEELYRRGFLREENEIISLTAQVEVLQSEKDNLERTLEETGEALRDARQDTAKEILQDLYDEASKYCDDTMGLNTYEIKQWAKKYGIEVDE